MRIENSFIPVQGIGESTERKLWANGITHWDEFDGSVVGPTRADRIETFISEAWTHLDDGDVTFFDRCLPAGERWRLYENFREDTCFFDIETTGLDHHRDRVTTVSFHRDGETTTLVQGEDLTAERIARQFEDAKLMVTFNGKRFDVPFLETSFGVDLDVPHVDLMYPCRQLGYSGGLKQIEGDVGVERDEPDITGKDAVRLWHEYERGNENALETLVSYNRDDAVNLQSLMETVSDELHRDVFETACQQS
ncbi:ribonuclease H-like domain-containing protein [Natranaeroarchaeum sulfidigenes]|uniref:Putative exonuclease, contains RNaseH-like domain n=1 Tax=Natranaeroarchaeum sulfidigenes TaxID=2784880 RepID=A0A897MQ66_9EURY|nr:ribonuclease H-like domain-containing protein [Natranaeroarchaeum sulfidigenes]QSG02108.1 putative exonuclease, contains RNaseH-like domain [Natranaeroarchaeum sulfidigenes]